MKKSSRVNHPPVVTLPPDNRPVIAPIYQTVKFEFDNVEETVKGFRGERPGFFYSRASNPTTRQLELTLAELQDREECLVCASGVGAIAQTLLGLVKQGDHILCFVETYSPSRQIIRKLLARFGVTHTMLSIEDAGGIERAFAQSPVRLVFFESPTNPALKIADIPLLTRLARAHGALTVLDNTFAGFHQHGGYDIDLYVHSLTKYASGAGDVTGGAVIGSAELIRSLKPEFALLGGPLDPHAAYLIQRGLKTYFVRYRQQSESAQKLAERIAAHPAVANVRYPGLATHPQFQLAHAQLQEFGTVISFDLWGGAEAGARFAERLELFALTASLGSTESLVMAPQMMRARDLTPEQLRASAVGDGTVRLSVGLEAVEDLLEDVVRALDSAEA